MHALLYNFKSHHDVSAKQKAGANRAHVYKGRPCTRHKGNPHHYLLTMAMQDSFDSEEDKRTSWRQLCIAV